MYILILSLTPNKRSENEEEKRLGNALNGLKSYIKRYEGKNLEEIEDEDDRRVVEIFKSLEEEYAFGLSQRYHKLGTILEVKKWCEINFGDKEKWERRLPSKYETKDKEEKRLAVALSVLRRSLKSYEGISLEEIEDEDDRRVVEIFREVEDEYAFGLKQKHINLGIILEIENWCKKNFGDKEKWKRRLPTTIAEDEEEKRLGNALKGLKSYIKRYEGKNLEEIEDKEDRKIVEIVRLLEEEYAFGKGQKYFSLGIRLDIENWCEINNRDKEKWERRLPINGAENEDERRVAISLNNLKSKILRLFKGKPIEEIENEEDRRSVEMLRRLEEEYAFGFGQKHYNLGTILKIENWCKINYGNKEKFKRKLPNSTAVDEEEKILGIALGTLRQKMKRYNGKQLEEIEDEDDRKIAKIIQRLDEEYNPKKVTSQSLGQAGFGSPVEECDKAQADLARRVEELESVKGVTQEE